MAFCHPPSATARRGPRQGKHVRLCAATRDTTHRNLLLRVFRAARPAAGLGASEPLVRVGGGQGRAAYVSARVDAVRSLRRKNRLAKALRAPVPSSIYDALEALARDCERDPGRAAADAFCLAGPDAPADEVTMPVGDVDAEWL